MPGSPQDSNTPHSTLQARRAKNRALIIIDRVYENFSQKIRTGRGAPVVWDGIEFVEQCTEKNAVKTCSIYEDDPANIRIFGRMQADVSKIAFSWRFRSILGCKQWVLCVSDRF